jgi:hypothetical protein
LLEHVDKAADDLGRRRRCDDASGRRAHQERFAVGPGEPMGLAASGQLIDRGPAILLPDAIGRESRAAGGIARQRLVKVTPAVDQAIQMAQIRVNLRPQTVIHGCRA